MSLISFKLTIDFIQSISKSIAIWHLSKFLIKFISAICNDLIEKQAYVKTSRLQLNAGNEFDPTLRQQYSNILEEQANDISIFFDLFVF